MLRASKAEWASLFDEVASLGARTIYLQWSEQADGGRMRLAAMIEAANERGIAVHVGLSGWSHGRSAEHALYGSAADTREALATGRAASLALLRVLAPLLRHEPSFAGWYIAEEPDDLMLLDPGRRAAWLTHVSDLHAALDAATPGVETGISTYVSGRMTPADVAAFWAEVWSRRPALRVLLQDGFGVQFLPEGGIEPFVRALETAHRASGGRLGIIVEVFRQQDGHPINDKPFRAEPATIDRLASQFELAAAQAPGAPLVAFAMPNYMMPSGGAAAAALGQAYGKRYLGGS